MTTNLVEKFRLRIQRVMDASPTENQAQLACELRHIAASRAPHGPQSGRFLTMFSAARGKT
jgi:hypothetical protein